MCVCVLYVLTKVPTVLGLWVHIYMCMCGKWRSVPGIIPQEPATLLCETRSFIHLTFTG